MNVSIVVIAKNEEKNIAETVEALLAQKFRNHFEVLVVLGRSTDGTVEIVQQIQKKNKNVHLLRDPVGFMASSRNVGIKNAKYAFVAFTDADCIAPKDWLEKITTAFEEQKKENKKLAGVGGANVPPKEGPAFRRAVGIGQNSWLGSLGSAQSKVFNTAQEVRSISCTDSLYDKKALNAVGGFTEVLKNRGEDWELGYKLRNAGYTVMAVPGVFVWHKFRATPRTFWKNMYFYGETRGMMFRHHPESAGSVYALPFGFLAWWALLIGMYWNQIFLFPLVYFDILFLYSAVVSWRARAFRLTLRVFLVLVIQHFAYALGLAIALLRGKRFETARI